MQTLDVGLGPDGPIIALTLGLSWADIQALRMAGRPVPAPVAVQALIDTGAEASCVDPSVLAPLITGVPPGRFVFANVPAASGVTPAGEYTVSLTVVHPSGNRRANLVLANQPVVEVPLGALGCDFLVGRDVLARCLLVYNGPAGRLTLVY